MNKVQHNLKRKAREAMERRQAMNVIKGIIIVLLLIAALGTAAYLALL